MLRDLFVQLFPNFTPEMLICNLQNLKQQMISAQVRLLILKETDMEERFIVLTRIAAIEREIEQQLFFYIVSLSYDEVPQYRNWIEKQDTTYGPLYARTFKRWQDELNWRPSLLYPPYLQHQSHLPLFLRSPSLHTTMFFDSLQNQGGVDYRSSDENAVRNFNMPFLRNPPSIVPPNFMDFKLPMPISTTSTTSC
ncbi:unnamed protein product [Cercopithifilaria johnstoni]|uniref:Uncharacterized protein n=1 Tax=Cercopithifilaria johnstoni TaxID=2874296 RepID=A0A8J2PRT7_9BILA|nr:unnamed protein product [Cercopithifilaria johnstoni]